MNTTYKIHPAIGIARVGDSDQYYIAPDSPGALPTEYSSASTNIGPFRDKDSKLLKQAAKFKVFKYDDEHPEGIEVQTGQDGVSFIEWKAWIANKKSSWFQFEQQTGSGMGPYPDNAQPSGSDPYAFVNDVGYEQNNINNPTHFDTATGNYVPQNPNAPSNPLRYNKSLGTTPIPTTINDPARQRLILDPGPRTVRGRGQRADFTLDRNTYPFLATLKPFPIFKLGTALTDNTGNLVILGGDGSSGTTSHNGDYVSITRYANNEGWFDDISDGPITAKLHMDNDDVIEVDVPAWVTVAPPAYAPEIINQVNMYDNMYDVFVRKLGANTKLYNNGFNPSYTPSWPDEILPILQRPAIYHYVANLPGRGVNAHDALTADNPEQFKERVFGYLRGRGNQYASGRKDGPAENQPILMPFLAGDNPISNNTISKYLGLTETQYFILSQYANGVYTKNPLPPVGEGAAIDIGNLQNCVGGAFSPGIEITWITRNTSIYKPLPAGFGPSDFFRINGKPMSALTPHQLSLDNGSNNDYSNGLEPGDLSKYMAQPWQADFNECTNQNISALKLNSPRLDTTNYWWWPPQRPFSVFPKDTPEQQVQWTRGYVQDTDSNNLSDVQMVTCWKYLGFVVDQQQGEPRYQEVSRLTDKINAYVSPPNPNG